MDCADCPHSPQNSIPVKLYTPKKAARAMMVGKVLHGEGGRTFYFDEDGFYYNARGIVFEQRVPAGDLSGLWENL
jgi:hypothetical protein